MSEVTAIFWDVGGVILSNGWDEHARSEAAKRFAFDPADYEERHRRAEDELETGGISLDAYLDETIFYRERPFAREEFKQFIFSQSSEKKDTRALLDELSASRRYFMATLNNESLELNSYRICRFDLKRNFTAFFTSCFLRLRKPDLRIYEAALGIAQRAPKQCVFIDDRPKNLEPAKALGMQAILFESAEKLRASLEHCGVRRALAGG